MNWESLDQNKKIAIVIATVAVILIVVVIIATSSKSESKQIDLIPITEEQTSDVITSDDSIFVEVAGQVARPGVYELRSEPLVIELVELAGGFSTEADLLFVHRELQLAVRVVDGQKIYIPSIHDTTSSASPANYSDNAGAKLNLNTATLEQLMELEGIGEVTAEKIIANRPYESLEELKEVEGIGDATYNKIITYLTL
jgi:competence protein ComEA